MTDQSDPRIRNLRDAHRRVRSVLIANADRLDKPFTDDPSKNPWDTFVRPAMRELQDAVQAFSSAGRAPATDQAATPTVWTDGHPQLEAIAAAVWEQCRTEGTSLVVDDPRNIAVAALAAVLPAPTDQTAVRARIVDAIKAAPFTELRTVDYANGPLQITVGVEDLADTLLRRMADEAQPATEDPGEALARHIDAQPFSVIQRAWRILGWGAYRPRFVEDEAQPECSASISGNCLREAQSETACDTGDGECVHGGQPAREAQQDPTQDGEERETDEQRADREETERDHAAGDHTHCGITCETELPTEHLRNFVIAKGYPGTKGALDELLRRAAVARPGQPDADEAPHTGKTTTLPYIHTDDDGDQLVIAPVMASTYDSEAPVVSVCALEHGGDDMATAYIRLEAVEQIVAALRAARRTAAAMEHGEGRS